jgi:4-hydroxybenzoate polyprenyltransferase
MKILNLFKICGILIFFTKLVNCKFNDLSLVNRKNISSKKIISCILPSFSYNSIKIPSKSSYIILKNTPKLIDIPPRLPNLKLSKINSFLKLIRYTNILPTILLFFSGGYIINPCLSNLLYSTKFIISLINTILVMSNSMILNDIFDIEVDKTNNPNRPLASGEISKKMAILYAFILFGLIQYLNLKYLPYNIQLLINVAIFNTVIYTPFIKKIPFIKNIFCANIVAFSIFFGGLASSKINIFDNKNIELLSVAIKIVFFGSLYNELLLDLSDYDGDLKNNIETIPVLYGKEFTWMLACAILNFNILYNALNLSYLYNYRIGIIMLCIGGFFFENLENIMKYDYSKNIIKNAVKKSNKPLFLALIYLCVLSRKP